jgi:RHS repeat-associated protein
VFFAGERIAESPVPLPAGGFPELPAESLHVAPPCGMPRPLSGLLWLVVLLLALAFRVLASPLRRSLAAAGLALTVSAASLSCHSGADRALAPDEHTRFHVADRLGSAALVLDHRGRVVGRDVADPYGAPRIAWRADDDTAGPAYRFTGKEDDALSGAVTMGARHYLPALGRWTSPDLHYLADRPEAALETPGEANPYGYVGGNPVTFTDPTGRKGLAHGSENRPGVLDSYPGNDGPAFANRMAAVARDRALAEYRQAQLASMAYGVLDVALTGLDWAMTASDVADVATLAMGPPGAGIKVSKQGAKLAIRRARKAVRQYADDALQAARNAAESLSSAVKPGRARRNAHLAGKKHPETGIAFDGDARPDFSPVSVKEVEIEYAGPGRAGRKKDKAAANKAAGFDSQPAGYDWHHAGDGKMQLVPRSVHGKTGHDGPNSPH